MILRRRIAYLALVVIAGLLLYDRYNLGAVRFLDLDEYAHLHWSFNAFSGLVPYKDFFYIFTPFYLYLIAPLILLTGKTFSYVLAARMTSFIIFLVGAVFLFLIAKHQRGTLFGLFTALMFIYLPLPADKWIEIRPDGLGTVLALIGIYLFFTSGYFLSGIFLSFGFAVNPKIIFYPLSVIGGWMIVKLNIYRLKHFILGLIIPVIILFTIFMLSGKFETALFSIFRLHQIAGQLMDKNLPMAPNLFFYPNDFYYGTMNTDFNYLTNLFMYVASSLTAILTLLGFMLQSREKRLTQLVMSFLFLTNIFAYIKIFPLKHTQYLIGVSPFVAYFFSELVFLIWEKIKNYRIARRSFLLIIAFFIIFIAAEGHRMNSLKARFNNSDSVLFLNEAKKYFTENEYVWDLTGATLFYKDPYYICCVPYGNYWGALRFPMPDLESELTGKNVKYIFVQDKRMLGILPDEHKNIVNKYYTDIPDTTLVLKKKI